MLALAAATTSTSAARWEPGVAGASASAAPSFTAASAELRGWTERVHSDRGSALLQLRHLARLLNRRNDVQAHRRSMVTVSADHAFDQGTGNCVSYAHLLVSAARSVGIPARFAVLDAPLEVVRRKGLRIEVHHMVVMLADEPRRLFDTDGEPRRATARLIDDDHAAAILLSNQGIEALLAGRHGESLRQIRRAVELRPFDRSLGQNLRVALHRAARP